MDTEDQHRIDAQLQLVQEQKNQQQKVASLWEQAREARSRGDLTGAQQFLGQALQIDEHSTDLRNAYSLILREIRKRQEALHVEELSRAARDNYANRQYTQAIARLREAAQIDPAHAEVQQLLFTVATRQKEAQRQELLERVAKEIRESLDRDDFGGAHDCVSRALESLPGEGLLLRMKVEVESSRRSFDIQQVVRAAMLQAQELFLDHPEQALKVIEEGLGQAPRDETLMQARARLEGHLRDLAADAARKKALSNAHSLLESNNYAEARGILVTAIRTQGPNADFEQLLALAKREQAQQERKQTEILGASSIPTRSAAPVPVALPKARR
jgi:serine/threonine-protein kinase